MSDNKPLLQTVDLFLNSNNLGGTATHNLQGAKFVRIEKSDYPIKVFLDDVFIGELKTAGYLRVGENSTGIRKITIENTETENNNVTLQYGDVLVGTDEAVIASNLDVNVSCSSNLPIQDRFAITATAQELLPVRTERKSALVQNVDGDVVYIKGLDSTDIIQKGIMLYSGQQAVIENIQNHFFACKTGETASVIIREETF